MIVAVMGPTASGKSELALRLAQDFGGEIVSADSMQLYRGLAVGTAQPTAEEQRSVPHHLLGCCDFAEKVDVFRFVALAEDAIADIRKRGGLPIVAGGTGFYLKALVYGLDDLPGDAGLRARLDAEYDRDDRFDELRRRMRELDPAAELRWRDCRRKLIRALEVKLLCGRSILELQQGKRAPRFPLAAVKLEWDAEVLRGRIAARTQTMLDAGWIEETLRALDAGLPDAPTAHQALGYAIIGEYLAGRIAFDAMRERIVTATWQLARRQRTWFRHQHPEAVAVAMPEKYERIRDLVAKALPPR